MTKNIQATSWGITALGTGGTYNSWQPNGIPQLVDGQPFTINGSGFGIKPQAQAIIEEDFQDIPDDTLLGDYDPTWIKTTTNGALVKSTDARYAGSKHAYNDTTRDGFATNYKLYSPQSEVFLSYWYSTEGALYSDGSDPNATFWVGKLSRINSTAASGGGGYYNGAGSFALNSMNPYYSDPPLLTQTPDDGNATDFGRQTTPTSNTWFRIDMHIKLGDVDVANGIVHSKIWGYSELTDESVINQVSGFELLQDCLLLGVMVVNATGQAAGAKITDVMLDGTTMRVELCNSPDFTSANHAEQQPCLTWVDTKIEGTVKQGSFPSGQGWIHVINGNNESIYNEEVNI